MKKVKLFLITCLAGIVLTSCVSNRKYKEAVSSKDNIEKQYRDLQANYDRLQSDVKQLQASSSQQLQNKETALTEKEQMLSEEQRKLQDMKSLIDAQRNAIRNLKQEVCSALKCFTPDELTINVRDGKLYV